MSKSPKNSSCRYEGDKIDFIIPFLIQNTTQKNIPTYSPSQPVKKTCILDQMYEGKVANELQNIAKIYNIPRKKTPKIARYYSKKKSHINNSPLSHPLKKNQSNISQQLPSSTIKQKFQKVKSQLNHPPALSVEEFSSMRNSKSYRRTPQKHHIKIGIEDSPILGIRFKSKEYGKKDKTEFIEPTSQQDPPQPDEFKGYVRSKVKYWKQKRQWDRIRGQNVDSIVNRNCKTFEQLLRQYTRRMNLSQNVKIFVFESKDEWMRRVLVDRGWIQNTNTSSKVFHLHWSNKLYKQALLDGQIINHYSNCYNLTTKGGLQSMLRKYNLSYLQPVTFDLSTQKNQFISYFLKQYFIQETKKFLDNFQFQDKAMELSRDKVLQQIDYILSVKKDIWKMDKVHQQLKYLLQYCKLFIDGSFSYKTLIFLNPQSILQSIREKTELKEIEQEAIRVISDFYHFATKNMPKQSQKQSGNIWITKSKISSKGVGLTLHNQLQSILKYENRLVQKYIERPLLFEQSPFNGRKFDLRIWVLVYGPLPRLYYHQKFYGRICFDSYKITDQNLKNENVHLTNFNQNRKHFTKNKELHQSIIFPQHIFSSVSHSFGINYQSKFYTDIQSILVKLFPLLQLEIVGKDSNCLQLFGCDIILDQNLRMYLLEVNMSASCRERHPNLTSMLQQMGNGIVNILEQRENQAVDLRGWVPVNL